MGKSCTWSFPLPPPPHQRWNISGVRHWQGSAFLTAAADLSQLLNGTAATPIFFLHFLKALLCFLTWAIAYRPRTPSRNYSLSEKFFPISHTLSSNDISLGCLCWSPDLVQFNVRVLSNPNTANNLINICFSTTSSVRNKSWSFFHSSTFVYLLHVWTKAFWSTDIKSTFDHSPMNETAIVLRMLKKESLCLKMWCQVESQTPERHFYGCAALPAIIHWAKSQSDSSS